MDTKIIPRKNSKKISFKHKEFFSLVLEKLLHRAFLLSSLTTLIPETLVQNVDSIDFVGKILLMDLHFILTSKCGRYSWA